MHTPQRVSKLNDHKWRLSQPETAQEPVGSPSDALLDIKDHMRLKFRLICV